MASALCTRGWTTTFQSIFALWNTSQLCMWQFMCTKWDKEAKTDVKSAFRTIPVTLTICCCWAPNGKQYFIHIRFSHNLASDPLQKFLMQWPTLEWIVKHNRVTYLEHYIFTTSTVGKANTEECAHTLELLLQMCSILCPSSPREDSITQQLWLPRKWLECKRCSAYGHSRKMRPRELQSLAGMHSRGCEPHHLRKGIPEAHLYIRQ